MPFKISNHALEQMHRRNISHNVVVNVLNDPRQIIAEGGYYIYQSIFTENGKPYLIRIFVNTDVTPNVVITVYKTSKISKYYEGEI